MAPTKPHIKLAKSKARRLKHKRETKTTKQLIADATASLEQGDINAAAVAATQALESIAEDAGGNGSGQGGSGAARQRQRTAVLSLLGEIHLEMGDADQARGFFLQAVEADEGASDDSEAADAEDEALLLQLGGASAGAGGNRAEKYLWLAQLSEDGGADSVRWYERGAAELRAQLARLDAKSAAWAASSPPASTTTTDATGTAKTPAQSRGELLEEARCDRARRLASALCAVAEVYMTDLSWESDAEQRCEALMTEATLLAPDSAEAWQTVASVRISQARVEDARAALQRSLETWTDLEPEDPRVPAFPSRVSLVRLLMEVEWEDKAVEVAERLIREDDESVEVLYLGGFGQFLLGDKLKKAGESNSKKSSETDGAAGDDDWSSLRISARRWLKQCVTKFAAQGYEDERLGEHAQELLGVLNKELGEALDDDDEFEGWEDADDDDDDGDGDGDEDMKG